MLAVAFLLASAQPDPTTVNGDVIGAAKDFTTPGPARVCMNDLMVTVLEGESVTLGYAGIHTGTLRLNRNRSWVEMSVGDIFVGPEARGEVVLRKPGFYIADASSGTKLRYGLFGPADHDERYRLQVWIDGPLLVGDRKEGGILRRIEWRGKGSLGCTVAYRFGWDMLFGNEPLVQKSKQ